MMARIRVVDTATAGIPAPFLDPAADVWHDPSLFAQLAAALGHDMGEPDAVLPAPCGRRRQALVTAWALANGYRSTSWLNRADHERLRASGVTMLRSYGTCPHRAAPSKRKRRRRTTPPR